MRSRHASKLRCHWSIRPARYGSAPPPWLAISFTSGKRSKKPSITMRATARVVSIGKPMLATRL
jgi:hypothetical protein